MTDPKRWSEAEGMASPVEQLLLRSGQDLSMPVDQKTDTWQRILGAIPTLPLPSGSVTNNDAASHGASATPAESGSVVGKSAAPHLLTTPGVIKAMGLVIALGGMGVLGHHLGIGSSRPVEVTSTPVTPQTLEAAPRATPDAKASVSEAPNAPLDVSAAVPSKAAPFNETARSSPLAASRSSTAAVTSAAPPTRASQLREESQATLAIRQALRSNDVPMALKLLDRAQQQFGVGALNEEREALMIESLARSGNRAQASKRAKAFLSAHPRSPHASDVRRYVAE